jgi:hypothetical protein
MRLRSARISVLCPARCRSICHDGLRHQHGMAHLVRQRCREHVAIAVDQLDVYAPEIFRDQRKSGRWMHAKQVGGPLDGLRLCRLQNSARVFGAPHFLATFHFDAGTLTLGRSVRLAPDVSRRLRFGFDVLLGTPREVSIEVDSTQFRFDNSVSLPESEVRVLSLAWRNLRNPEGESELRYFHSCVLPLLSRGLARPLIVPTLVDRRLHA